MQEFLPDSILWWLTMIDIPALTGLLMLVLKSRKDANDSRDELMRLIDAKSAQIRDQIAADKIEAIKSFATINDVKELEKRLVSHLLRIEAKLDVTALKAESRLKE